MSNQINFDSQFLNPISTSPSAESVLRNNTPNQIPPDIIAEICEFLNPKDTDSLRSSQGIDVDTATRQAANRDLNKLKSSEECSKLFSAILEDTTLSPEVKLDIIKEQIAKEIVGSKINLDSFGKLFTPARFNTFFSSFINQATSYVKTVENIITFVEGKRKAYIAKLQMQASYSLMKSLITEFPADDEIKALAVELESSYITLKNAISSNNLEILRTVEENNELLDMPLNRKALFEHEHLRTLKIKESEISLSPSEESYNALIKNLQVCFEKDETHDRTLILQAGIFNEKITSWARENPEIISQIDSLEIEGFVVPESIASFTSLLSLKIVENDYNMLSTVHLPESISELRLLNLNIFGFIKYLPKSIGVLSSLENLSFSGIRAISKEIRNLKSLKKLEITLPSFSSIPTSIFKLINLEELSVLGSEIESIPEEIENLKFLKKLNLNSELSSIPASITNLVNLEELNVRGNQRLHSFPDSLLMSQAKIDYDFSNVTLVQNIKMIARSVLLPVRNLVSETLGRHLDRLSFSLYI